MSYSDYSGALTLGRMHRLLARLLRRDERLVMLDEASQCSLVYGQTWPYTQDVPVEQITGTVDRPYDFDSHFHPIKAHTRTRWMRVNEAIEAGANLPPVKLYKFGDAYFVRDGHHRVSVARFRGSNYVDAVVTELFEPKCA